MNAVDISMPTLQVGDSSTAVQRLQNLLSKRASIVAPTVDGTFGPDTEFAVRLFQYRAFLENDGIVGPQTWSALIKGDLTHLPILRRGSQGGVVERLQRVLTMGAKTGPLGDVQRTVGTRGYYFDEIDEIDGDFGPLTEQAVKDFQKLPRPRDPQTSLSVIDGIVGPETWEALQELTQKITHVGL